jgi:5'-deoxynucleotidase YfbR-like HD superfamily hydrolase
MHIGDSMKFFLMNSGRKIYLEDLSVDDVHLSDIAHHLTKICRYGGGLSLNHHYSVANHSIALYYYAMDKGLSVDIQRNLLMHDATEAYLGDVNGILKQYLPDYMCIEEVFKQLIWSKYQLSRDPLVEDTVKQLDKRILLDEAQAFYRDKYTYFQEQYPNLEPLNIRLYPEQELSITKAMFLHCCEQLNIFD